MKKKKQKFVPKYVYGPPVCKKCGTKVFLMTGKHRFKCVLCRHESVEKLQGE
jgi:tRNA(Ile2) C34 agmatinyltransferase TiaS